MSKSNAKLGAPSIPNSAMVEKLRRQRENLLLAEIAALLHDMGKCTVEFAYAGPSHAGTQGEPYKAVFSPTELGGFNFSPEYYEQRLQEANDAGALHTILVPAVLGLLDTAFRVDGNSYTLREAIYFGRPGWADRPNGISRPIGRPADALRLLGFCHGEAHVEKEYPESRVSPDPRAVYSPFGSQLLILARSGEPGNLTGKLSRIDFSDVVRHLRKSLLTETFNEAVGDTRFPINEVTLWDWSYTVACLFKSELARHVLTDEWREKEALRWRLLRINFDVLGLFSKAIKVADLLGYQERIEEACQVVKELIECEYPLGNEVYRDTTGIYFIHPDLDLDAELANQIKQKVEEIEPELAPRIQVDPPPQAQNPKESLRRLLAEGRKAATNELRYPFDSSNLSPCWQNLWDNVANEPREICPVCRLRPKAESDEVCGDCKGRRSNRVEKWKEEPSQTVWLDEIADHNSRVAFLVAKFGLDDWLSGDLVQTLLVRADGRCTPKNPSPARLRRIWDTCQSFWAKSVEQILASHPYGSGAGSVAVLRTARMLITPSEEHHFKPNVPYDGTVQGKPISLIWLEDKKKLVSIINLELVASEKEKNSPDGLRDSLNGAEIVLQDPDHSGCEIKFKATKAELAKDSYRTYRPTLNLLTSPDQFMALVPASDALQLAEQIRCRYALEFGKVRDRLPLFLGLIFFHRKTPLFAVMDLGRRMVDQVNLEEESWSVECSCLSPHGLHQCLRLSREREQLEYCVPLKMGDHTTEDMWYPYIFFEGHPNDRKRRFQFPKTGNGKFGCHWLVHAGELRPRDQVRVWPSRFSFTFLEHSAQRFEFNPKRDIFYLDELPRLREMWDRIRKTPEMTDTKLRSVISLLAEKAKGWGRDSEEFRRLAETTLRDAKLLGAKIAVDPEDVTSGRFDRCLELYLHILKQRVKEEGRGERDTSE